MTIFKRYTLPLFFFLAYLFSWLVWATSIAQANGSLSFHVPDAFAFIGLSVASVVMALASGGIPALRDLISRWLRWRVNPVWYAVALLLTAVLCLIASGIFVVIGGSIAIGKDATLPQTLMYILTHLLLFLVTEETAWRGFALPRLQKRYSALTASLILGVLWGAWHIPLFLVPGSFQSTLPFVGFILSAMATCVLHTWIFNHTDGSVLIAAIFHAATDGVIVYLGVATGATNLFWVFVGVQVVAAVIVTAVTGARYLSRRTPPASTVYPPA
jgi:membrane protease YdiL (CAAX protease family)